MPTIRVNTPQMLAGDVVFPLLGNQYEYLPFNARVEFAVISDDDLLPDNVKVTVFSGTDILQQEGPLTTKTTLSPVYPDDFLLDDIAAAGERLSVQLSATVDMTVAKGVQTVVKITPL